MVFCWGPELWLLSSYRRSTVWNPALAMDESGVFEERAAFRYPLQEAPGTPSSAP